MMQPLPHTRSCFVCGEANPLGLRLRFESDGRLVRAKFSPRAEHNGFKGVVHGGLIATVLDEIMFWACAVPTRRLTLCAELNVRYLNPLPPDGEFVVTGELVANRKDRIYEAKGALQGVGGVVFATATGKYVPLKNVELSEVTADLVGDPGWFRHHVRPK